MRKRMLTGKVFLFVLGFASPLWAQSGASVQYVYDALGRLTTVVDPSGNVATYNYDAVGNLLSITRSTTSPSGLAIFSFSPGQGSVGQTVTIQGQNFSATPSSNTVKFNGTSATVTAATTNSLTTTVPSGATTGPICVDRRLGIVPPTLCLLKDTVCVSGLPPASTRTHALPSPSKQTTYNIY